jgi:predicted amidohydrolase YtcJ
MPYRSLAPGLILYGGAVHTMDALDRTATAVAIGDGRIVGVGLDDEIRSLAGLGTVEESLEGRTLIPGLIDAHNHLIGTGALLNEVQLFDCRSIGEIVERVRRAVKTAQPGDWILGRGWDESLLDERRHPTRHDLDPVSPGNPVVLHRVWNKLVANSAAMQAAGVDRNTPDPPASVHYSGSFERDKSGNPTGLFRDRAKQLVLDHVPVPSQSDFERNIETACRHYNAAGLTAVAEPGLYPHEIRALDQADRDGALTVRVDMLVAGWGFGPAEEEPGIMPWVEGFGLLGGFGSDMLRLGGVKFMPDGGIGDRTAKVSAPYEAEPDNTGQWVVDPDALPGLIRAVHNLGYSIDAHTCGDVAQEVVVRAYADAQTANPKPWVRHRVHHAYLPNQATISMMARHKIPAVVSNPFITHLGESFVVSLGEERASRMMPMRSYLDAGVPLAGSSDSYVSDFNPWVGLHAATTRQTVAGRILGEAERISTREALRAYTIGGAFALGWEKRTGSIEPGKLADLVLLENDLLEIAVEDLAGVRPLATMVGGRWVFDRR